MNILGIDTSSKVLSIALGDGKRIIVEESHLLDRRHSSLLVLKIKEMLEKLSLSIDDVGAFVVGLGPGSFTGLRIGVSSVKGFGIATKKPCIGIPSIDAMALNVDKEGKAIVPVIDAKRNQVYSAIYRKKRGHIIRESEYLLLSIDKVMEKIGGPAVFLGDGINLYRERIQRFSKKAVFLGEGYWYPKADNLIKLVVKKKIRRYKQSDLARLKPIYLYPEDCQVKKQVV